MAKILKLNVICNVGLHSVGRVLAILKMWRLQFFKVFYVQPYLLLTFIDYKD